MPVHMLEAEKHMTTLLTVQDGARDIAVSKSRMYELLNAGEIESVKIGRSRKIVRESLTQYVERLRSTAGSA